MLLFRQDLLFNENKMTSKKTLITLGLLITIINAGLVFAANEQFKNFYGGFGYEDHDPDGDGFYGDDDKCPISSFNLWILNSNTKKEKVTIPLPDPKNGTKTVYLRVKKINNKEKDGNNNVQVQTSSVENFGKDLKEYTIEPNKIASVDAIGKRFKILYSNSTKGVVIFWTSALAGSRKGCTVEESRSAADLTPP